MSQSVVRRTLQKYWLPLLALPGVWLLTGGTGQPAEEPAPTEMTQLAPSPRAEAEQMLVATRQALAGLRDYRAVLVTRERLRGRLLPEQTTEIALRTEPFAVRLRWREPAACVGQQVWYDARDGKMRVRSAGLASLVGVLSMDPHAPTVRDNSRHAITEAGMANMVEAFAATWDGADVRVGEALLEGHHCRVIEVIGDVADWHRARLHLDAKTNLPVRVEYHNAAGHLVDEATYRAVEVNVGLDDSVFRP